MSPFEYVIVLISIILGLGITQIVTGVADLAQQWNRVKIYWPHLCWIVIVFFLHVQEWWATYELRNFMSLRLPTFLFVLFYPINLFVLARILFPLAHSESAIDLKQFYFSNYRKIFLWAALLPVLSLLNNLLVTDHRIQSQAIQVVILAALAMLISRKHLNEWVHKTFAILMLSILVTALALMWNDTLSGS